MEEQSRETIAKPWAGSWFPTKGYKASTFGLFWWYWNPHEVGEVNINDDMLPTSTWTPDQLEPEGWWCWLPFTSPPTYQENVHEMISLLEPLLWNFSHCSLQVLRALALCPLCLAAPAKSLSQVWLSVTPQTAAHQAPPSMGFSRQEHWSGVPLPSPFVWQTKLFFSTLPKTLSPRINFMSWQRGQIHLQKKCFTSF